MKNQTKAYKPTRRETDNIALNAASNTLEAAIDPANHWLVKAEHDAPFAYCKNLLAATTIYLMHPSTRTIQYRPHDWMIAMSREYAKTMKLETTEQIRDDITRRLKL